MEQVTAEWIAATLKRSFHPNPKRPGQLGGIEPYFDPILPMTFSMRCGISFIRANPSLPISRRDFFLSKLLQFVIEALKAKFGDERTGDMENRLHEILDRVPADRIPPDSRVDWVGLWWDTYWDCHDCPAYGDVLGHLEIRIEKLLADPMPPDRRPGPKPDAAYHRTIRTAVEAYERRGRPWKEHLKSLCAELDRRGVAAHIGRERRQSSTWGAKLQSPEGPRKVIKSIEHSIRKTNKAAPPVNESI